MFGTIAKMKLKPGSLDKMRELGREQESMGADGFLFSLVFKSAADPDEAWLVVGFRDEASYRANSADPATDKMARQMQELMAGPPEWHDGEVVSSRIEADIPSLG